jgi:hypothetical protein
MNIALGALIILLLLLPALFFRLGITAIRFSIKPKNQADSFSSELVRKNFLNALSKLNFSETLFFFSIIPLIFHLTSVCFLHLIGKEIDYQLLLNIFTSQKDIVKNNLLFNQELTSFLFYILFETALGFFAGILLPKIFVFAPDFSNMLIGDNLYLKLFTGLLLDEQKRKTVDLVLVDIVSETKEATVIYSGLLEKFDIVPEKNELAYITLSGARRRDLRKNSKTEESSNPQTKITSFDNDSGDMILIPGKYFTIPGSKISNVNVTYIQLQTIQGPNGQNQIDMVEIS